eukprot:SAG11_NODE_5713_length_1481_cov_1.000724_1_plen_259_part_00
MDVPSPAPSAPAAGAAQTPPEPAAAEAHPEPNDGNLDAGWCAAHDAQLGSIGLPPALRSMFARKLRLGIFDAGECLAFSWSDAPAAPDAWSVVATRQIEAEAECWIADHIWLFPNAVVGRQQLVAVPELQARLLMLLGLDEDCDEATGVDKLLTAIAPWAHPITFAQGSEQKTWHAVADEIGSRISFVPVGIPGAEPNACVASIYDHSSKQTYSVIWPCADIEAGTELHSSPKAGLELFTEGKTYWERHFRQEENLEW